MKTLFVVNERSGLRRPRDAGAIIREGCSEPHEIVICGRKEDLDEIIARAERENFDVVCAVGGDGTVHEVGKRLIGRSPALGILPTGSGNGYARHLRMPAAPLRSGSIAAVDTAEVNGMAFLGVMGAGLDAVIAHRFAASGIRGLRTYVKEGLKTYMQYRPERYVIEVDGKRWTSTAFVVAVANSSQYGNNARIAPLASLQDGLLDVVIVEELSLIRAPLMLVRLFNGTLHKSRSVKILQGRNVVIRRPQPGPVHLDGEPFEMDAELRVRVVPLSLRVLLPANAAHI